MDLAGFRAQIAELVGSAWDADNWPDATFDAGLRQALWEYEAMASVVEFSVTVATSGAEQIITRVVTSPDLVPVETQVHPGRPLALAWPWYEGASWRDLARNWRQVREETTGVVVTLEGITPQAGDVIRVRARARQTIEDLDAETATTAPAADERLLVLGAAGHAGATRARQHQETYTTTPLAMRDVRAWSEDRLREFRAGLLTLALEAPWVPWRDHEGAK